MGDARERDRGPGFHDDHAQAPDGGVYRKHAARVSASRAQELLASGALMAVDDCGCGGYCGLDWPDATERRDLARRPPRLSRRRFGWFEEWHTDTGHRLLVQYGDVRWP